MKGGGGWMTYVCVYLLVSVHMCVDKVAGSTVSNIFIGVKGK